MASKAVVVLAVLTFLLKKQDVAGEEKEAVADPNMHSAGFHFVSDLVSELDLTIAQYSETLKAFWV